MSFFIIYVSVCFLVFIEFNLEFYLRVNLCSCLGVCLVIMGIYMSNFVFFGLLMLFFVFVDEVLVVMGFLFYMLLWMNCCFVKWIGWWWVVLLECLGVLLFFYVYWSSDGMWYRIFFVCRLFWILYVCVCVCLLKKIWI